MGRYRIVSKARVHAVVCCICKAGFDALAGPVLQCHRARKDGSKRWSAVCRPCGLKMTPELASLLPEPLVDATPARWLARVVLDDNWEEFARRLVTEPQDPESQDIKKALSEPGTLPMLAAAWPVAIVEETIARKHRCIEPNLTAQLGKTLRLYSDAAREQRSPHLLNAAILFAEIDQALRDIEIGKAAGVHRLAALAASFPPRPGVPLALQDRSVCEDRPQDSIVVLSKAAPLMARIFSGLLGKFAVKPAAIAPVNERLNTESDGRVVHELSPYFRPVWAPLIALAVHIAAPWWLRATLLPEAVGRLEILFCNKLLQGEIEEFAALKEKHSIKARRPRHGSSRRAKDNVTSKERLEWAQNCVSKVCAALVRQSLWVLGVDWEDMKELLAETRGGGGRLSRPVGDTSSEDDNSGGADGESSWRRKERRFGHGKIRKSVMQNIERCGGRMGPPGEWTTG